MLVALDRRSGEVIWKSTIPDIGRKGRDGAAFSSIVVSEAAGVRQFVQLTGRGLVGVDAGTGRFLWGYNDISNSTANIPTPIVTGDFVFAANGYHSGAVLLQLETPADGDGVNAREVYRLTGNRFQNHHGGYILIGDHIYGGHGSNNGLPTCIELKSGKIVWKRRGPGIGSAAVVAADGHVYFRYQNGVVALIEVNSAQYRSKGTLQVPGAGGDSWAHPVIAHGKLYLREKNDLWVYDVRPTGQIAEHNHAPAESLPEWAALIGKGAEVERVDTDRIEAGRNRLYRFAVEPTDSASKQLTIVTLSNRHVGKGGTVAADVLNALRQLKSPFVLSVAGTRLSADGLAQIATLKQVVALDLELCRQLSDDAFQSLHAARRLTMLMLTGTLISEEGLRHIARIPNLVALDLEVCDNVLNSSCPILGQMKQLRALVLKKTGFEADRISDQGLRELSGLSKLEVFNLYGNAIKDDGLKGLHSLKNLRELDLSLMQITDTGLSHLRQLKTLRRLDLLYSEGFAGPTITDAGVKSLTSLNQLIALNLVGARITDDSVKDLAQFRNLRRLMLVGSRISDSGIRQLKQALPGCTVIAEPGGPPEKNARSPGQ